VVIDLQKVITFHRATLFLVSLMKVNNELLEPDF
jgi:hypothetical protein